MPKNNLKIEYVKINKLTENPNNAKIHTDEQVQQIIESIKEFGFNDPIGVDENFNIIEGHGRFLAAKALKIKDVPVIVLPGMNEEQKIAYAIIHNKLTANTDFDIDKLNKELQSIEFIDLSKYSFEVNPETFFDEEEEIKKEVKNNITAICDNEKADGLRQFLKEKNFKFKEK